MLAGLLLCSAPKDASKTNWQTKPVTADGKPDEWQIPLRFFDKTTQLNYDVTNDRTNLYIAVRITDETTLQQISMAGLTVKIDTVVKSKNAPFTLTYPSRGFGGMIPPPGEMENGALPTNEFQNGESIPQQPVSMQKQEVTPNESTNRMPPPMPKGKQDQMPDMIKVSGFNHQKGELLVLASESEQFKAGKLLDSTGIYFMEIVIPFETFFKPMLRNEDSLRVFNLKLSFEGGLQRPGEGTMPHGGQGGPPQGGGGPGGGGGLNMSVGGMGGGPGGGGQGGGPGGGGPGGPGEGNSPQKNKKQDTNLVFTLSTKGVLN